MIYKRIGHWHLDVTIHGVRYRQALNTTDKRQAKELEKNRIAEIKQGKNASKTGREFARKPFYEAVKVYLEERGPHVSHGREALGAGKTGKRSDGRVLGNEPDRVEESELKLYVTIHVTTTPSNSSLCLYLLEMNGGRDRTRTCDLLRVKQAL